MSADSISILVPVTALPAEGESVSLIDKNGGEAPELELLKAFVGLLSSNAPRFEVASDGRVSRPLLARGDENLLDRVTFRMPDQTEEPCLELSRAWQRIDWDAMLSALNECTAKEETVTGDDVQRLFCRTLQERLAEIVNDDALRVIPLIGRGTDDTQSRTLVFYGAWLTSDDCLARLPARQPWGEFGFIFKEEEVEGRGLREVVAAAALLALVTQGAVARTDLPQREIRTELRTESPSPSRIVQVSSQRLAQDPPRVNEELLARAGTTRVEVIVDIGGQRAYLLVDGQVALDTPVSTAGHGRYTPRGVFRITEKVESGKRSTIYGSLMPFWMRLDQTAIGMHVGKLPGQPDSHGCIRLPREAAELIFRHAQPGTEIRIVDSWTPTQVAAR